MKLVTLLILFVHKIYADDEENINVGTVLFTPDDLKKDGWSVTNVELLRARRYFQYVLPPPSLIDPSIDEFADAILNYFTEAVDNVSKENLDPLSTGILTAAISDVIGGYMKAFVIPVAKYGYYGGTVTKDDAQKIYQFYDDVKEFLKTDGATWRNFDGNFQKPLKIIGQPPTDRVRAARDSCSQLTFYEETPSGYTIPLPTINFDRQPPLMFVPVKGNSIVSLNSPSSANTLLDYYQSAKECLKSKSPRNEEEFDNRFRRWLTNEVLTHLDNDGQLFYALGGILSLANSYKDLNQVLTFPIQTHYVTHKPYLHIIFGSKKIMVLTIILFLEMIWCIPALCYMCYSRRRKNKKSNEVVFVVDPRKANHKKFSSSSTNKSPSTLSTSGTSFYMDVYKKRYKNKKGHQSLNLITKNDIAQTTDIPKCSRATANANFYSKSCSTESFATSNKFTIAPKRSSLKNTTTQIFVSNSSHQNNAKVNINQDISNSNNLQHVTSPVTPELSTNELMCKPNDDVKFVSKSADVTKIQIESDFKHVRSNRNRRKSSNNMATNSIQCKSNNIQRESRNREEIINKLSEQDHCIINIQNEEGLDSKPNIKENYTRQRDQTTIPDNNLQRYYDDPMNLPKCSPNSRIICECSLFHQGKLKQGPIIHNIFKDTDNITTQYKSDNEEQIFKNDVPIIQQQNSVDISAITFKSNDASMIISKLDSKSKTLQKDTNELVQLIKRTHLSKLSTVTPNNEKCQCLPCMNLSEEETCATITLIASDDANRKNRQIENLGTEIRPAFKASNKLTKTHLTRHVPLSSFTGNDKKILKKDTKKLKGKTDPNKKPLKNDKPIIGVTIEKPHTAISIDISTGKHKASRIPTRIVGNIERFNQNVREFNLRTFEAPIGSKIPLPVRKTTDDIVFRNTRNKTTTPDPRLNVSL